LLNLETADEFLAEQEDPIRFLVPVHLFGHAIELQKLAGLKRRFGFRLVEDCAQAISATSKGIPVGTIGDMAALSFYPTKNLGCMGDGGAVLSSNDRLAAAARALRDYGQTGKYTHAYLGMKQPLGTKSRRQYFWKPYCLVSRRSLSADDISPDNTERTSLLRR
jgi:dTDP-4-amino-4,6-dideoxygalactose transaminase